jgi:hypothetical protein
MKKLFTLIIVITTLSCSEKRSTKISGVWDISNYVEYVSDTISITNGLSGEADKTTVKTDSGIMVISHFEDSIISIMPTTKTEVLRISLDDNEKGVLSQYQIDSDGKTPNKDPRWTALNNNFWVFKSNGKQFIVADSHFDQLGNRLLDTSEYKLLAPNKLLFDGDTLTRINEP